LVDVGGGCDDDIEEEMDDVSFNEVSNFPVHDPESLVGIALQRHDLQSLQTANGAISACQCISALPRSE